MEKPLFYTLVIGGGLFGLWLLLTAFFNYFDNRKPPTPPNPKPIQNDDPLRPRGRPLRTTASGNVVYEHDE